MMWLLSAPCESFGLFNSKPGTTSSQAQVVVGLVLVSFPRAHGKEEGQVARPWTGAFAVYYYVWIPVAVLSNLARGQPDVA